jgi:hypothetical protein
VKPSGGVASPSSPVSDVGPDSQENGVSEDVAEEAFGSKESKVDFSQIDPRESWECFGTIEPDHVECKSCQFRVQCAQEAGVEL